MTNILDFITELPDGIIYLFLGISAFIENIFPPAPGDTIVALGAFLAGMGRLSVLGVYISTTIGSVIGFMALFYMGRLIGPKFFNSKIGRRLFPPVRLRLAMRWFHRYGLTIILLNRFIVGIRSVIAIAGGMCNFNVATCVIFSFISASIWNLLFMLLGYSLGSNWDEVLEVVNLVLARYSIILILVFIVCGLLLYTRFFIKKRRKIQQRSMVSSSIQDRKGS